MFYELIATLVAGLAMAGIVMLLNKTTGGRLPKWAMPVGAGAAMLTFTIWSEYNWYDRTVETLPEGVEVATTVEQKVFYQPWTYLVPYISRFAAVDHPGILENEAAPDHRLVPVLFMGRWAPARQVHMMFDCAGNRRIDMVEGVELDANGLPVSDTVWYAMDADDVLLQTACRKDAG